MNRRSFVKQTLATAAVLPFAGNLDLESKFKKNIGIQIYTIRDLMQKDATGSIKAIAAAGYKNLELAGYNAGKFYGLAPMELKTLANGLGMKILSSHVAADLPVYFKDKTLPADYLKSMDDAVLMGQKFFVWPFIQPAFRNDKDNAMRIAELFNKAGMEAKNRGLQFGYHNHAFEFDPIGDTNMMNIFLKETDPKIVKLELDLYWVVFGKQDPIALIKNNPGRFALYHIKDMANTEKRESIEIGDGTIDFNKIFKETKNVGAEYFIVEQEAYRTTSLDAIKTNYKRINKLKF
ncbi:MAG: sugar phosphate isomerase/epimerase [Saprospiraceae bacterium]